MRRPGHAGRVESNLNIRALGTRLGQRQLRRRLAIEQERIHEHRRLLSPRFTAFKMRVLRPLLACGLRATRIYDRGYRQFCDLRVVEHSLPLRRLPPEFDGFAILQLSDLHIDLDLALVEVVETVLRKVEFDLCVMTGDYRNSTVGSWHAAVSGMQRLLRRINVPVYAILGNHDFLDMVPPLERAGMRFLLNESVRLERAGSGIHLVGIDDPNIYRTHNLARALRHTNPRNPTILLSHSPVIYREAARRGVDAVLAGHTHGGQICLPDGRIVVRNDRSPRHLLRGPWRYENLLGYTSPGTGACGLPVRFHCPPEVTLHTLTRLP